MHVRNMMVISALLGFILAGCQKPQADYLHESPEAVQQRMAWWQDARFGMFIHWGLYAIPGGVYQGKEVDGIAEWIMNNASIPVDEYEKYAAQFNPVNYNPDAWVRMAKDAGIKYIVITSKHHDGFCLWDSQVTKWDVVDATPYGKDLLAPLKKACDEQGIKLCFYHSIMDWHHPNAQAAFYPHYNDTENSNPNFPRYVEAYMKPQLKELITNYGPLGILWFDGEWIKDYTSDMGKDIYNYVRSLQPDIIINNRVDKGRQGMQGMNKEGDFAGDYGTPEQEIPDTGLPGVAWESCMTMNTSWGYKETDHDWKSSQQLVRNLIDIASKGGNYLLNVGPKPDGTFPQASIDRLADIGAWMQVYGEAIYGTSASPVEKPDWGRFTSKPGVLYAHVFERPEAGRIEVPVESHRVKAVYEMSNPDAPLDYIEMDEFIFVLLPDPLPNNVASVVLVEHE